MVKDHSDSERGNLLPPHGLLFSINSKGSFICTIHRQDSTYHSLCYTSRGALAGMRNSSMGPPHEGSIRRPIAPWANALTTELHLAPNNNMKTKCNQSMRASNTATWFLYTMYHTTDKIPSHFSCRSMGGMRKKAQWLSDGAQSLTDYRQ